LDINLEQSCMYVYLANKIIVSGILYKVGKEQPKKQNQSLRFQSSR